MSNHEKRQRLLEVDDADTEKGRKTIAKTQNKLSKKIFSKMVDVHKYVNPANSKVLNKMREESFQAHEIQIKPNDPKVNQKLNGLYTAYIKEINDDLIENTDKLLDVNKRGGKKQFGGGIPNLDAQMPRTDNTMKKPQHAWWKTIDNSYSPFVTCLQEKPHSLGPIHESIVRA